MGCLLCPQSSIKSVSPAAVPASSVRPTGSHVAQAISNQFETHEQLIQALHKAGLEKCNLLVALDFTNSNTWSGTHSFQGKSLHHLVTSHSHSFQPPPDKSSFEGSSSSMVFPGELNLPVYAPVFQSVQSVQSIAPQRTISLGRSLSFANIDAQTMAENRQLMQTLNPYQFVLSVVGEPLESFDDDHIIPTCIFGHKRRSTDPYVHELKRVDEGNHANLTHSSVSSSHPMYINGVIQAYEQAVLQHGLSGGTLFTPVIQWALNHVKETKEYHVLLIIGDGAIDDFQNTQAALALASNWPLSVVFVGVGDGSDPDDPVDKWKRMRILDEMPTGKVDNFQSVYLTDMKAQLDVSDHPDLDLATAIFMEIPAQYQYFKSQHMIM